MSETALKFGPEWLRALSHGGNLASPPPSPGLGKFKLADYRYGREEMLALFTKQQTPPDDIHSLGSLYIKQAQDPLAFISMNEEEQRMWQRGVNSDAVLRLSGRPIVNGVGRGRGGSVDRGRGRGRGAGVYYSRGLSYEDEAETRGPREGGPPGIGGLRSKPFERSQSVHEQRGWGERGGAVGPAIGQGGGGLEERSNGAASPRKEQGRASTENWRSRGGDIQEEGDRWRGVGRGGSRGWRERENGDGEWDDIGVKPSKRNGSSARPWDGDKENHLRKSWEEDNLPEWATENMDEKGGSFDATGAFHGPGWSDEEEGVLKGGRRIRGKAHSPDKGLLSHSQQCGTYTKDDVDKEKMYIREEDEKGNEENKPSAATHEVGDTQGGDQRQQGTGPSPPHHSLPSNVTPPLMNGISSDVESDSSLTMQTSESSPTIKEVVQHHQQPPPPQVSKPNLSQEPPLQKQQPPSQQQQPPQQPPPQQLPQQPLQQPLQQAQLQPPQQPPQHQPPQHQPPPPPPPQQQQQQHQPQQQVQHQPQQPQQQSSQPNQQQQKQKQQEIEQGEPELQQPPSADDRQVEEEKLEHMQSVADDLVAKLVEEDDPRPSQGPPPGGLVPMQEHTVGDDKWYYTDPQGEIQGPFPSTDMAEWYKAGYFTPNLLLKRECDDKFAQLGDLTRVFGRVPFLPGPVVPPLKVTVHQVTELLSAQKAQAERERLEQMQSYMLQKQLYQQQVVLRQQVLQQLQGMDEWNALPQVQQQQLFMQHMMTLPTLPVPPVPPPAPTSLDPRLMASSLPTTAAKPHDPIQALVAQMAPTSAPPSSSVVASSGENLVSSKLPVSSTSAENPLQKLLLQLQRGSQQSLCMGTTPPVTASSISVSSTTSAAPLDKPAEQFDAIQSLMQQLNKMQPPVPHEQTSGERMWGGGGRPGPSTSWSAPGPLGPAADPTTPGPAKPTPNSASTSTHPTPTSLWSHGPKPEHPEAFGPEQLILEEQQRRREEEQKRLEEERRRLEEQKRAEEERIRQEELRLKEEMKRQEEQRRQLEALRRKHEEETQRLEEERRKIQEEQIRRQDEMKRIEEEKKNEERKKQEQAKKEEEKRRLQDQQRTQAKRREEEMKKREEEAKRKEETRRLEEEERQKQEEQRRRDEEESARQAQIQEEMRRMAVEEERRRMQQLEEEERQKQVEEEEQRQHLLLQERLKQMLPAWNTPPVPVPEKAPAPSLADIQRAQEEKERKEREVEIQLQQQRQREAQVQAAEEARQKSTGLKWAAKASVNQTPAQPVKSLLEIQAEEEKELKKRREKEAAERAAAMSHMSLNAAGVWGSAAQSLSWASRASNTSTSHQPSSQPQQWGNHMANAGGAVVAGPWGNQQQQQQQQPQPPQQQQQQQQQPNTTTTTSVWNNERPTANLWNSANSTTTAVAASGGFWDDPEPSRITKAGPQPNLRTPTKPATTGNNRGLQQQMQQHHQVPTNNRNNKKKGKDEGETVRKLFSENMTPSDGFTQWCKTSLTNMKVHASIDIPTFVSFLSEVESPYEVHDYIRSYLGDSKEVKDFAKQYLERRSKARNAQKERHGEDNMFGPAPAVTPGVIQEFQEVKGRSKKGKKKMQKVDSSILGFSVTSDERISAGERVGTD